MTCILDLHLITEEKSVLTKGGGRTFAFNGGQFAHLSNVDVREKKIISV